jgi:adenine-specific DNA-methyltransferase
VNTEDELETSFPRIFQQLVKHRNKLEKRYNYDRFIPWWHWVFLRNKELMEDNEEKIFIPCKERVDAKGYARFALARGNYYATQDVTVIVKKPAFKENIKFLLTLLNSDVIFTWLKYKGLRRGGVLEFSERPLASIPVRLIDWSNENDVNLHAEIVNTVDELLETKEINKYKKKLEERIERLYNVETNQY